MRPKTLYDLISACEPIIIKQKLKVDIAALVVLLNLRASDAKEVVIGLSKLQNQLPGTFVAGLITEFYEFDIFKTMARFNVYKTNNAMFSQILKSHNDKKIPYAIVYSRSGIPVCNGIFDLSGGLQLSEEISQSQKPSRLPSRVQNRGSSFIKSSLTSSLSQSTNLQSRRGSQIVKTPLTVGPRDLKQSDLTKQMQNSLQYWFNQLQNASVASLVQDARFGLTHTVEDIVGQLTLAKGCNKTNSGGDIVYKLSPTGLTGRVLLSRILILSERCSNMNVNLAVSRPQQIEQLIQLLTDLNAQIDSIKMYVDNNEHIKDGHLYIFDQFGVLAFEGDITTIRWPNQQLDQVVEKLQMQQIDLLAPDTFSNATFNEHANEQLRYVSREATKLVSSQLQISELQTTKLDANNDTIQQNDEENALQRSGILPLTLLERNALVSSQNNQSIRNYFDRSAKVEGFFTYCVELTPGTAAPQQEFPKAMHKLKRAFKPSRERQTMFVIRIYRYTSREMFNAFALDPNVRKYRQYDRYQIYFNMNVPFKDRVEEVEFVKNKRGKIILEHRGQEIPPIGPATAEEIRSFEGLYQVEAQLSNLVRLSENAFDQDNPLFRGGKPVKSQVLFHNNAKNLSVRDQQIVDLVLYTETVTFEYSYKVECGREKESDQIDNQEIDALLAGIKNHSLRTKNSLQAQNSKNQYIELWVGQNLLLAHRHRIILEPESEDVTQLIVSVRRRDVRSTVPEQRAYCLIPVATYLALSDRWVVVEFLYDPAGHTVEVRAHGQQGMYVIPQINRQLVDQYITMLNNFPSYFAEEVVEKTALAKLEAKIQARIDAKVKMQQQDLKSVNNTFDNSDASFLPELQGRSSELFKTDSDTIDGLVHQLQQSKMDGLEDPVKSEAPAQLHTIKRNFKVLPGVGLVNVVSVGYVVKIELDFVKETYSDEEVLPWKEEPKPGQRLEYKFVTKSSSSKQSHIVIVVEKSQYYRDDENILRADVQRKRYSIPMEPDQDGCYRRHETVFVVAEGEDFHLEIPGLSAKEVNMMDQMQKGLETGDVQGRFVRSIVQ